MNKLLIFGYGNPGRGDDALGSLLAQHIELLKAQRQWHHVDVLTAYQLQIENAMDIAEYRMTLFIDAHSTCSNPYHFSRCQPESDHSYTTHTLTPDALLSVYCRAYKKDPPPCYLLSIHGESFELGQSLSKIASKNLNRAITFVEQLCQLSESMETFENNEMAELTVANA